MHDISDHPAVACRLMSDAEAHHLASLVGSWFAEHAEMDRARFWTLLNEAKVATR